MAMKTNPVTWFEIAVNDVTRAKKFYEGVLGVTLNLQEMGPQKMAWFPMEMGLMGSAGTLVQGPGYKPSLEGSLVYLAVNDVEAALAKINKLGGKTLLPKTSIGEWGFIAHFQDPEGNRVALHANQ